MRVMVGAPLETHLIDLLLRTRPHRPADAELIVDALYAFRRMYWRPTFQPQATYLVDGVLRDARGHFAMRTNPAGQTPPAAAKGGSISAAA